MNVPTHPALVHVPVVLYPVSAILRALAFYTTVRAPGMFQWAHYFNAAALIATIPTALTGYAQYKKTDPRNTEARKLVMYHIALNTIVSLIGLYNFISIRKSGTYVPTKLNVILGLVGVALLGYSGHIGGRLVFEHGIGQCRRGTQAVL